MNNETIEKILRNPPAVAAPAGLLKDLQAVIHLENGGDREAHSGVTTASRRGGSSGAAGSWLRRWIPALGFAVWFVGCIIVLGVQSSRVAELKKRATVIEATQEIAPRTAAGATDSAAEIERLKQDVADVQRLRAEIEQLRNELAELPKLRADNARLRAEMKSAGPAIPKPEEDFFATQQDRQSRIVCINHIKQFCLAARMWLNDSKGEVMPTTAESLKPYLRGTEDILVCPKDGTPYEIVSPGASERHPEVVFIRCRAHNNVGLCDGSAQQLSPSVTFVQRDFGWILERAK